VRIVFAAERSTYHGHRSGTGDAIPLFHPRLHAWSDHFIGSVSGEILGLTAIGRATITSLSMNRCSRPRFGTRNSRVRRGIAAIVADGKVVAPVDVIGTLGWLSADLELAVGSAFVVSCRAVLGGSRSLKETDTVP
jgi:hypothetical protein